MEFFIDYQITIGIAISLIGIIISTMYLKQQEPQTEPIVVQLELEDAPIVEPTKLTKNEDEIIPKKRKHKRKHKRHKTDQPN